MGNSVFRLPLEDKGSLKTIMRLMDGFDWRWGDKPLPLHSFGASAALPAVAFHFVQLAAVAFGGAAVWVGGGDAAGLV